MANQVSAEPDSWRELLPLLEQCGAPMLPIGAGAELKGPVDPATGYGLGRWQQHPGFSAAEIGAAHGPVIAAGIKTGGEARILVLDIDGATASEWIRGKGIEPDALQTWRVNRDTDPARFKLVFRLTAAQEVEFPQTKLLLQTKQRDKEKGIKGEAVEVYFQPGAQVVVIGAHPSSGGNYIWQGSPAEIATPDAALMALLQAIKNRVEELRGKGDTSTPPRVKGGGKGKWHGSSHRNPCPVCGRNHSAACTRSTAADGTEFASCYQGSSFQPPLNLTKGNTHIGHDGREWAFVREYKTDEIGWKSLFKIHTPRPPRPAPEPPEGTPAQQAPWGQGETQAEQPAGKQQPQRPEALSFDDRWALLELHAAELACTTWPVMKTIASLSCKASELEIPRLGQRQLEQLLEQAQRRIRDKSEPVHGGQTFTIKATQWAVEGIFRHGLNLLTGQSGAGKSRLAAACMAAWLRGDQTWLQRPLSGDDPRHRHALIIGTDQNLEDWHLTLGPVGLTTKVSDTEVKVHPRLTIYSLETGIQLDADGLNTIRRWVDDHPGGMVLVDSLAQCLPPGVDEDKSTAARPVHQLQEVLGDAWAILTHHTRKGAGKEGNLGVGAGRGSGAIDAAVSRVVGLGLIYRMENGVMLPQESDPRRELLSTKRGGKTEHLIISSDASGAWDVHGNAEALKAQERQERTIANLTEAQSNVLSAFDTTDGWLTTRGVVEAMGETFDASSSKAAGVRKVLKRLVVFGVIEERKVANENTYRTRPNPPNQREVEVNGSVGSVVAAQGISLVRGEVRTGSVDGSEPSEPTEPPEPTEPLSEPLTKPPQPVAAQRPNHPNHSPRAAAQVAGSDVSPPPSQPALLAIPTAPIGSGADVLDSDEVDDPAWGKRPVAA
jgi:hypothetical protein